MSKSIKQYTTVYHEEYGKGHIMSITYRRVDNLLFCSFGKGRHGFITEKQLRSGNGDITLHRSSAKSRQPSASLEDALRELLGGGGHSPSQ